MQNIHYQEIALALARLLHSMKTPTVPQPIHTHLSGTEKELISLPVCFVLGMSPLCFSSLDSFRPFAAIRDL